MQRNVLKYGKLKKIGEEKVKRSQDERHIYTRLNHIFLRYTLLKRVFLKEVRNWFYLHSNYNENFFFTRIYAAKSHLSTPKCHLPLLLPCFCFSWSLSLDFSSCLPAVQYPLINIPQPTTIIHSKEVTISF